MTSDKKRKKCKHKLWTEEGDGHGHNYWQCVECGHSQWVAPWIIGVADD